MTSRLTVGRSGRGRQGRRLLGAAGLQAAAPAAAAAAAGEHAEALVLADALDPQGLGRLHEGGEL